MKILQIPDGLKNKALELADKHDAIIYCESCYGACDICDSEAKALGCDEIIHYGHSKFMESEIPVEYVEMRQEYDPRPVLQKDFEKIEGDIIGLVSAVQYLGSLEKAREFLENNGKKALIGKGNYNNGQILGCEVSAAKSIEEVVDSFLYIGSGKFHPLGLAIKTKKPVFVLDVEGGKIEELDKTLFEKQKYAAIALSKDAKKFGILVSTKPGQKNIELAKKIKKELEEKGKKAYILVFNEIRPEKLLGISLDCYINTACPRVAIENRAEFKKPILNPDEMENFK
ncbi:MAG: diphthamide biosynthesis enzyme Dph2 [Candidatus Aenigmarchaeota archaeon]|nr:diphthamide biosynthesis enzyme Dph2 [Candidatus Aenigmarchaeota archaeon]